MEEGIKGRRALNLVLEGTPFAERRTSVVRAGVKLDVDPETLTMLDDVMPPMDAAPTKIYVAASVSAQGEAARFAVELQQADFVVTSRWLTKKFETVPKRDDDWRGWIKHCQEWSKRDLEDLAAADALVVLCDKRSSSGGMDFELGWWIGAGRGNVVLVGGERRNVFNWLPGMRWTIGTEGLVDWLKQWRDFGPWARARKEAS